MPASREIIDISAHPEGLNVYPHREGNLPIEAKIKTVATGLDKLPATLFTVSGGILSVLPESVRIQLGAAADYSVDSSKGVIATRYFIDVDGKVTPVCDTFRDLPLMDSTLGGRRDKRIRNVESKEDYRFFLEPHYAYAFLTAERGDDGILVNPVLNYYQIELGMNNLSNRRPGSLLSDRYPEKMYRILNPEKIIKL